jgi:hypothetical protein
MGRRYYPSSCLATAKREDDEREEDIELYKGERRITLGAYSLRHNVS